MRVAFIKCHGSGNDFPLIDARVMVLGDDDWAAMARALADRAGPVGGDGLLLLTEGDDAHEFGMRMFNSDGSEAEICLNGLRCVARLGFEALGIDAATVRLKVSSAGVARAGDLASGVYTVRETAGPASLDAAAWPLGDEREVIDRAVGLLPGGRAFTAVAMPNPHLVAFVDRIDEAELVAIGEACEAAPAWLPNRANVSFVAMRPGDNGDDLFVRTFERGVGLTDSCGSAMAASTYAACLTGRASWDREIGVFNRGGMVRASADRGAMITIHGNATVEYRGSVEVDLATAQAGSLAVEARAEDEVAAWSALAASVSAA